MKRLGFKLAVAALWSLSLLGHPVQADATNPDPKYLYEGEPPPPVRISPACVDEFAKRLEIRGDAETDPVLLNQILNDDMMLRDLPPLAVWLGDQLTAPQPMGPMLGQIREGIVRKHPAILEFLCTVVQRDLIPSELGPEARRQVTRVIHHTYLLEEITRAVTLDRGLWSAIQAHLLRKRIELGVGTDLELLKAAGPAMLIKSVSVESGAKMFAPIRERGYFEAAESLSLNRILSANIAEATALDLLKGYPDNASSGAVLASIPFKSAGVRGASRELTFEVSRAWASLYQSWNFAFIVANATHLGTFLPKLLIPSVMGAEPDDYLFQRVQSLSLTLNFVLFAKLSPLEDVRLPSRQSLGRLWGEINRRYAKALAR